MAHPAPPIDPRTATKIARQAQDLLKVYAPDWHQEFNLDTREPKSVSAALIGIFARYAEIIIQRLNRVPEKNFLAFLDLLGASLLPPQPARVPLTFSLAAGSSVDAVVPAGTQVAAPPAEGEKEPVIFETERELVVTAAQLASIFVRDPAQDKYADQSTIIAAAASPGVPVFQGNRRIEHILYLGHSLLLGLPQIQNLRLTFTLEQALGDTAELEWQVWNGATWQKVTPQAGGSPNLTQTGANQINLGPIVPIPTRFVDLRDNRWLRCQLVTPITRSNEARPGLVRESQLPKVSRIQLTVGLQRPLNQGLRPEAAFTNSVPIELGTDFFPFGEKPKLSDVFYLANAEAFSKDRTQNLASTGATVNLQIQVANSHLLPTTMSVRPSDDLQLAWECWNGTTWQRVGISQAPQAWWNLLELDRLPAVTNAAEVVIQGTAPRGASVTTDATDATGTRSTPIVGEDRRFAIKAALSAGVNVITFTASYNRRRAKAWIAIFLEMQDRKQTIQLSVEPPDLPVKDDTIKLNVIVEGEEAASISQVRVTNGSNNKVVTSPRGDLLPIALEEGRNELLIEALDGNDQRRAATTLMISREAKPPAPDAIGFADGTYGLCQSGIVTLRLPDTVGQTAVNGLENYWLRVRLAQGDYGKETTYHLKDPTKPEEGFILILATFRPPIVSEVKIGYEQMLSGIPELCLAYNNLAFEDFSLANQAGNLLFLPFQPAPDNRPTLYLGFTLPPNRTDFPNRTLTLFNRVADFSYGEIPTPIWPSRSRKFGDSGTEVVHQFIVTNAATTAVTFNFAILGTRWDTSEIPSFDLAAGASQAVEVQVAIPPGTPLNSSDSGFIRLTKTDDPLEYGAAFVTFADTQIPAGERLQLAWQYWDGAAWDGLTVRDDSENFTRPALVQFLAPPDFTPSHEFGLDRYWLRVRWESGDYTIEPRLQRVLLNTTIAAQTVTIRNETVGSSDGSEGQTFQATRAPILAGQQLQIREPEMPPADEQALIERAEGEQVVSLTLDATGRPTEIWVHWHEVPDFYASGPRDRHYVLDHISGKIRFGDGLNGLIPPVGSGNLRLAHYRTGGGVAGNKPANTIVQLKTTVPYVNKVTNPEAATGGANAETLASLLERAPRTIRHRGRAVTLEDYEDLARLASPEVAWVKCVPLRNLVGDPLDTQPIALGEVSVIIVPHSTGAKPRPSLELIRRVQDYVETNSLPTVNVSVVGPLYVSVNVTAEIALVSLEGASMVEQAVHQKLAGFLHPLTGGLDGAGWAFGREPYRSDFYALIEAVPGVDHIRILKVVEIEDQPGIKATGRFLVYSGVHEIRLVFEEK